jgi:hypothetical protein
MPITVNDIRALKEAMEVNDLDAEAKQFSSARTNYELLATMLDRVSGGAKEIVLEFIRHYDVIKAYDRHVFKVMERLAGKHKERIILFPLKCRHHSGSKSGDAILYEFRSIASVEFPGRFLIKDSPFNEKVLGSGLPKYAVDDFIGTGEQFLTMFNEMLGSYAKVSLQGVACVAAMRRGACSLEEKGFHVEASVVKERAIADYLCTAGFDTASCYTTYDSLEAALEVDAVDRRGRNASEALVSLKRTPNNTLPIFWSIGKDKQWPAPFKRA